MGFGYFMLRLTNGPYGNETKFYRVPMSKDEARKVAADFRRRIGCSVRVIPYAAD